MGNRCAQLGIENAPNGPKDTPIMQSKLRLRKNCAFCLLLMNNNKYNAVDRSKNVSPLNNPIATVAKWNGKKRPYPSNTVQD